MSDVLYQVYTEGEDGMCALLYETYDYETAERYADGIGTDGGAIKVYVQQVCK